MCHIICSEPNSPTFGWGIPHYFFSQSGLQNPHNGENSPLLDTLGGREKGRPVFPTTVWINKASQAHAVLNKENWAMKSVPGPPGTVMVSLEVLQRA